MAIALRGSATSGQVGTNQTPALGSGWQPDDLHIIIQRCRATTDSVAATPSGYTDIDTETVSGNVIYRVSARLLQSGDVAPTLSQGGVAVLYHSITLSGVRADTIANIISATTPAHTSNSSSTAINYPASGTPSEDNCAILVFGTYNTSGAGTLGTPTTLSGGASNLVSMTGTNMKSASWLDVQTTAANVTAGNIPITGGSTQTNRGGIFTIRAAAASNTTASPDKSALAYTGLVPSLLCALTIAPTTGTLSLQGLAADTQPSLKTPALAALSLSGLAPEVIQQTGPNAGTGAAILNLVGLTPTLVLARTIEPMLPTGAADTTELAPTILTEWTAQPAQAALTLAGAMAGLIQDGSGRITPDQATLTLAGGLVSVSIPIDPNLGPTRTTLDLIGLAPEIIGNWVLSLDATEDDILPLDLIGWAPTLRGRVAWHDSDAAEGATWRDA